MGNLTEYIKAYIAERLTVKLEAHEKSAESLRSAAQGEALDALEVELEQKRRALVEQYQVVRWLTDAAQRASQISLVTHAAKYTHSDTRSSGVLFSQDESTRPQSVYLSSASLLDLAKDVVGNAAALDVAGLLQLQKEGVSLVDEVAEGDSPSLKALANNVETYQDWLQGFKRALHNKAPQSGQLSKQLYFPVGQGAYHIISPLYATSLTHLVSQKVNSSLFSDNAKEAREARKKARYHPHDITFFPQLAIQNFGGTKPQNISLLNSVRRGQSYLFSSQPPVWTKQDFLPKKGKQSFWDEFGRRSWPLRKKLQGHLAQHFGLRNTVEIREQRGALIDELIDVLLQMAAEVQTQKNRSGWSVGSDLPYEEQLWLDPHRVLTDTKFQQDRERGDWRNGIARSFAHWLNHLIDEADKNRKKKVAATLQTGEDEFQEWYRLLERKLRSLKEDMELAL